MHWPHNQIVFLSQQENNVASNILYKHYQKVYLQKNFLILSIQCNIIYMHRFKLRFFLVSRQRFFIVLTLASFIFLPWLCYVGMSFRVLSVFWRKISYISNVPEIKVNGELFQLNTFEIEQSAVYLLPSKKIRK